MTRRSFTLIEMVVSLGILLMILTISAMALAVVQKTWKSTADHEASLKQYRTIDLIVDVAFRNAIPFYWRDRNNKEVMIFSGKPDAVTLAYLHRINDRREGGIRFLRLFRQNRRLIAEYRKLPFLYDGAEEFEFEREVIAENVTGLSFIYADRRDDRLEWLESWDAEQMKNLPLAIQMEVRFSDGTQQNWLRRTAGNGQFQEWGRRLKAQK